MLQYHVIDQSVFLNSGTGRSVVYFVYSIQWDISETTSLQGGAVDQRSCHLSKEYKGKRTVNVLEYCVIP